MSLSKSEFTDHIKEFEFRELFNKLGWNSDTTSLSVKAGDEAFSLTSVGQKSGFKILVCQPGSDGRLPDSATRKKIETAVAKRFPEHLIVFQDSAKTSQLWQWVARQSGKPSRLTETRWNKNQAPELLFQKASGIFFSLNEEENITIVDVTQRIAANFDQNNERVTKRFYEVFKKQHTAFYDFLSGIDDHIDEWNRKHPKQKQDNLNKQWYVSLMLNRLMFCYFIQKKGFLNRDKNYLRNKLAECQAKRGTNKYYSFYRDFLLALFHDGLGAPDHVPGLKAEIGTIPYLNGGLFDAHQLEKDYDDIQIDDEAFATIFDFFDQYEWHLDTTANSTGREINPDVIGYIFEKYINERAAMGAYYTKEDITDYISKNCILPFLFDETKRNYAKPFKTDGEIWSTLKLSGDTYIYDAVKKGVDLPLPDNIEIGVDTQKPNLLERRKDWNRSAHDEYALPTEIWREVVDRRRSYSDAKAKIKSGEITGINDFITFNLNIRQFVQDVVEETSDPKFLEHFYKALNSVTILDPTCGSGAFLFAAMNILEPLYLACLQRMRSFTEDEDKENSGEGKTVGHKFPYFREVLKEVQNPSHPNLQYFIYKSIILRNLYGVDIMNEAVEIAKLRLFLKLVATLDADFSPKGVANNLGLEPLPDIDFNIRAGNTLVGYTSEAQIENLSALLVSSEDKRNLLEGAEKVARAFKRFKEIQLSYGNDFRGFKDAKDSLNDTLNRLKALLDKTLFSETSTETSGDSYNAWLAAHKPFHWLAEFYEIVHDRSGFDVIIGNPPYIEYSKVAERYTVRDYETIECGNVYAFVVEQSIAISTRDARLGLIVPISLTAAQRMEDLQNLIVKRSDDIYFSNFALRPAALFPGVMQRITIFLMKKGDNKNVFTTDYRTWYSDERPVLFDRLAYQRIGDLRQKYSIPKVDNALAESALRRMLSVGRHWHSHKQFKGNSILYYHNAGGYWIKTFDFRPYYRSLTDAGKKHTTISELYLENDDLKATYLALLNSSTFYFFWKTLTDARHIYPSDIAMVPISLPLSRNLIDSLESVLSRLMSELRRNASRIIYGSAEVDQFSVFPSKAVIDDIDKVLAKHYGFTDEELDFIINYDIKYRMGRELDNDSGE